MKERIVTDFLQELLVTLAKKKPSGWEVANAVPNIFAVRYSGISIWQPEWKERYYISLEAQDFGKETVIGVWRNGDEIRDGPNPAMLERFLKAKWPGKANRWWEWYVRIPPEYGWWQGAEALLNMRFKTKETVDYFASRIMNAAEIAAPLLKKMSKR